MAVEKADGGVRRIVHQVCATGRDGMALAHAKARHRLRHFFMDVDDTLGRMAHENPVIMPDHKTVYLTDDGGSKAFFKFVADNAGDLSSGTLYAAKMAQDATRDVSKAGFDITWIELGHASNAEIEAWINEYDDIDRGDYVDGGNSYITDAEIEDWAQNGIGDDRYAFIESLKAAAAKGATVEFNKMEGINDGRVVIGEDSGNHENNMIWVYNPAGV